MSFLEYYKKNLSEDVESVEQLYLSANLTEDTSGIEYWDRVTYSDGRQEYSQSVTEYDHNVSIPFDMPEEWLQFAVEDKVANI